MVRWRLPGSPSSAAAVVAAAVVAAALLLLDVWRLTALFLCSLIKQKMIVNVDITNIF